MPAEDSFADLMVRLRGGDEAAAAKVFHRFTNRLIGLARLHLDSRVRRKVDPEDVLQSVFRSFFLRHAQGEFDFQGWDDLWALLALLTARKCGRWARRFHTAGRDVNAEVPAADTVEEPSAIEAFAADPSPSEVVMLAELVEQLVRDLGQANGAILTPALQGYSAVEIVTQLDRPRRTVYRVLEQIKARLQAAQAEA